MDVTLFILQGNKGGWVCYCMSSPLTLNTKNTDRAPVDVSERLAVALHFLQDVSSPHRLGCATVSVNIL